MRSRRWLILLTTLLAAALATAGCDDTPSDGDADADSDADTDADGDTDADTDGDGDGDGDADGDGDGDGDADGDGDGDADGDGDGDADGDADGDGDGDIDPDLDDDGLLNHDEDRNGNGIVDPGETDPRDPDTDNDGQNDFDEAAAGDADHDGLSDAVESSLFDEDGDGLPDEIDPNHTDGPCAGRRLIRESRLTTGLTLTTDCSPYLIDGDVVVSGAAVTIQAGVTIRFRRRSSLQIGDDVAPSALLAPGEAAAPIVFQSDDFTPRPGDWGGLIISNGGFVRLSYLSITNAGEPTDFAEVGGLVALKAQELSIANCTITDNDGYGIFANVEEGAEPPEVLFTAFASNDLRRNEISLGVNLGRLPELDLSTTSFGPGRIDLFGSRVERSLTLADQGVAYWLEGDLEIVGSTLPDDPPSVLTLAAGVELRLPSNAALIIGDGVGQASLNIAGAAGTPVVIGPRADTVGPWAGIEMLSGANSISDAWLLSTGSLDAVPGTNAALVTRGDASVSFGGTQTVIDSVGMVLYQQRASCADVPGLPGNVNVLGYTDCRVYCEDTVALTESCIQL